MALRVQPSEPTLRATDDSVHSRFGASEGNEVALVMTA